MDAITTGAPTGGSTEAKQDIQILNQEAQIVQLNDLLQGQTDLNLLLGEVNTELDAQTSALSLLQDNLRQRILKAVDREQLETYADFGTKNERIVQISYTAASVGTGPGFTALKTINYVLDGNNYRRTTTVWSII